MINKLYRIVEVKCPNRYYPIYYVEIFKRLWYWPFKKTWQDAISWDECGFGVPYFSTFEEAEKYVKSCTTPVERKVIYEDKVME